MPDSRRTTGSTSTRSGRLRPRSLRLGLALLGLLPGIAAAFDLDRLLSGLARVEQRQVNYHERRELALLDAPLESRGVLIYEAPQRLIKQVIEPHYSRMEIDGDRLLVSDGMHHRELGLDRHPALRGLAAAYRATLAGDAATLRRHFETRLSGDAAAWRLELQPRDPALAERLKRITLSGSGDRIAAIDTEQPGGDRSHLQIDPDGD